jgi:uncharacterized protein (TIGR04255 family)
MPDKLPVKFGKPPVVEVACGILFASQPAFHGAHIGLFWEGLRKQFPSIQEAPPLPPIVEIQGAGIASFDLSYNLTPLPPLRRTWLASEDGRSLIQIQQDRFIFNWKKSAQEDSYPSYEDVVGKFNTHLTSFLNFLTAEKIPFPKYRQFELTYFNHIPVGNSATFGNLSESNILVDHRRSAAPNRFLPEPEVVNWTTVFSFPDQTGRLYATAQSGTSPTGERILQLEMAARGSPLHPSEENRQAWFNLAHEWITRGFADLTDEKIQEEVWDRKS